MAPTQRKQASRQTWDKEAMKKAILAVRENKMGFLKASKTFKVPKTTLIRLSKKENLPVESAINIKLGRKATFPEELENDLVKYILVMEHSGFGLTRRDIKILAYQVAEKNNLKHKFSEEKKSAGKTWLRLFLNRHPELSFRRPTGTSIARMKGFNKENVKEFYDLLEKQMEEYKFPPSNVYNVDETGISVVPSKMPKILSLKGKKQIAAVTSAERGSTITCVMCMSAGGSFVPPLLIFPRKRDHSQLMKGAPPGAIHACHPSGWIQTELFTQWFKHFLKTVKPSAASPVLLILDGHTSHTRNIDLIDLARENHVHLLSIPPHSSHKIQPLDKTFMGPIKKYLSEEIRVWVRVKAKAVTHYDIAEIFGRAYVRAQCAELAINGFQATGIYPLNRHVFKDHDFIDESQLIADEPDSDQSTNRIVDDTVVPSEEQSTLSDQPLVPNILCGPSTAPAFITPEKCCPIPRLKKTTSNRGRKSSKAMLLTSSPYKKDLEESLKSKKEKESQQTKTKLDKVVEEKNISKKKIQKTQRKKGNNLQKKKELSRSTDLSDFSVNDESLHRHIQENAICFYCNGLFSEDIHGEQWIQCVHCSRWAHEECSGIETDIFVCEFCAND